MHRTLKRLFVLALAAALTATVGTGAFAAELVIFDSDKRELYQRYAQEPAVLTVCEDCGGALQAQDTAAGRWFDTGFTRDCEEGVAYTPPGTNGAGFAMTRTAAPNAAGRARCKPASRASGP